MRAQRVVIILLSTYVVVSFVIVLFSYSRTLSLDNINNERIISARNNILEMESEVSKRNSVVTSSKPSNMKNESPENSDLLLSVPFYIYEEFDWLSESSNTTIGQYTFQEWIEVSEEDRQMKYKENGDLKFYLSAVRHPMRVKRPEDAK